MKKGKTATRKVVDTVRKTATKAGASVVKNPISLLYVGGGILAVIALYQGYQVIKKLSDGVGGDPDAGGGNLDPGNAGHRPIGATITNAQAETAAATILSAVDSIGGLNNVEFETVKKMLRKRNAKDFALISGAFGTPARSPITGEETFWFMGEALNLSQWLSVETENWQKNQLRQIMPDVF